MTRVSTPVRAAHRGAVVLPRAWCVLGRASIVLLAAVQVALFAVGVPYRFQALTTVCPEVAGCGPIYLSPAEAAAMPPWLSLEAYAAFHVVLEIPLAVVALTVLAVLLLRLSHTRMGLVTALALAWFAFPGEVIPALADAVPTVRAVNQVLIAIGFFPLLSFLYLFPNDSIEQRWVRRLLPVMFASVLIVSLVPTPMLLDLPWAAPIFMVVLFGNLLLPLGLQIVRYRVHATPVERQQVKWALLGLVGLVVAFGIWFTIEPATTPVPNGAPRLAWYVLGNALAIGAWSLLPITLGFSVMRRRLWDLDAVVNRALVYGALTVTLAAVYLSTVIVLQRWALGGRDAPLVVAVSTLLIAALFAPLRRRLQRVIDRRFYREKVDRRRALAAFATTARREVDSDALRNELLAVVADTLQPSTLGLWLRPDPGERGSP